MTATTYVVADVRDALAAIPDGTIDLILTSPPFLSLRSYLPADHPDKHREIGSEPTPAAFLSTMLDLTGEWRRILAPHGSICVELGDTYAGSGGAGGDYNDGGMRDGQQAWSGSAKYQRTHDLEKGPPIHRVSGTRGAPGGPGWPLAKSLCGIPHLYHLSLAYGRHMLTGEPSPAGQWRVRNVVAWTRPNPPVGALGDKVRPATSYLTWACISKDRWFDLDAVRTPVKTSDPGHYSLTRTDEKHQNRGDATDSKRLGPYNPLTSAGAPPLDHWSITPGGYAGAHYAVFPAELCRIPIEASCPRRVCRTCGAPSRRIVVTTNAVGSRPPVSARSGKANIDTDAMGIRFDLNGAPDCAERETTGWTSCGCPGTDGLRLDGWHRGTGWRPGLTLDPFAGSGTTMLVAHGRGRASIGIDLDARNLDLARDRLGMWLTEATVADLPALLGARPREAAS